MFILWDENLTLMTTYLCLLYLNENHNEMLLVQTLHLGMGHNWAFQLKVKTKNIILSPLILLLLYSTNS